MIRYDYYENIKRFHDYEVIDKYLKDIKLNKNTCLTINTYKRDNYLLGNSLLLYKKIGSDSVYGVIYKCKNVNSKYKNIPTFTLKIQLNTNSLKRETDIFIKLSKYALKNKIPNLPILYKVVNCNKTIPKVLMKRPDKAIEKGYTMLLNELAAGDLRTFLSKNYPYVIDDRLWRNTYAQIFMSLAILHSLGIKHNDAHDGNFLYHKINPGGCFHYNIDGIDYYIENLGFLWTSWDYGLVSKIDNHGEYVHDYMLINLCMRKNDFQKETLDFENHDFYHNYQWGYLSRSVSVPKSIEDLQDKIWNLLGGYNKYNHIYIIKTKKMPEPLFLKELLTKGLLFSTTPIGKVISSVKLTFPFFTPI
jgi:serine/threonine protein kinase